MSYQLQVLVKQELYIVMVVMFPGERLLMVLFSVPRVWLANEAA